MKPGQMFSAALKLSEQGHAGQFDKGGTPYIFHPLTVMKNLKTSDEELQCIALLHDYMIAEVDWIRLAAEYLRVQVDESLPVISGSFDTTLCETLDLISECKDMTKPTVK